MPLTLAVYITGHGYGHATRTIEILTAVRRRLPSVRIHLCTTVPKAIIERRLAGPFSLRSVALDVGAAERNTLDVDEDRTLAWWQDLMARREELLRQETEFLSRNRVDAILFDIPPLAAELAARSGVPAFALGSFGWDEIYEAYAPTRPAFHTAAKEIRGWYGKTAMLLQMRLGTPMAAFPERIRIPAVGRRSNAVRERVREELGLRRDEPAVLVALRDRFVRDPENLGAGSGLRLILPGAPRPAATPHTLSPGPAWEHRFADLIVASDAVLSKAGYGILAECLANRRPLLHFRRRNFSEWSALVEEMDRLMPHALLEPEAVSGDTLREAFEATRQGTFHPIPMNGAEVAADHLVALLPRR